MSDIVNGFLQSVSPSGSNGVLSFINRRDELRTAREIEANRLDFDREDSVRRYDALARELGLRENQQEIDATYNSLVAANDAERIASSERVARRNADSADLNTRLNFNLGSRDRDYNEAEQRFSQSQILDAQQSRDAGTLMGDLQNQFVAETKGDKSQTAFRQWLATNPTAKNRIRLFAANAPAFREAAASTTGFDANKPIEFLEIAENPGNLILAGSNRQSGKPGALTASGQPLAGSNGRDPIVTLTDDDLVDLVQNLASGELANLSTLQNASYDPRIGALGNGIVNVIQGARAATQPQTQPQSLGFQRTVAANNPALRPEVLDGATGNAGGTAESNALNRSIALGQSESQNRRAEQSHAEDVRQRQVTFDSPNRDLTAAQERRQLQRNETGTTSSDFNLLVEQSLNTVAGNIDMNKAGRFLDSPYETIRTTDDPNVNRQRLLADVQATLSNPNNKPMLKEIGLPEDINSWSKEDFDKAVTVVLLSRRRDTDNFVPFTDVDTRGKITPWGIRDYLRGVSPAARRTVLE